MSQLDEFRETVRERPESQAVASLFDQWYHVITLFAVLVFMLWTRIRPWQNFVSDGQVLFSGNDAWYHLRETTYTIQHWPETMPFDIWTQFPYGTSVGQFGTIFDQLVATVALIVGLGSPDQQTTAMVLLFAPAITGTLVAIPTYYLGKRLHSRLAGVLGAVVLALATGGFLNRSMVGFSDHQVAEALAQALAALAVVAAIQVAQSEKPVYELVADRDWNALRRPLGYGIIAGTVIAIYQGLWPPGVVFVGILGLYITLQAIVTYLKGDSPEHTALVFAILFGTTSLLLLGKIETLGFGSTSISFVQVGLPLAGFVWTIFLAGLAREFDDREITKWVYPVAVLGTIAGGAAIVALALPDVFSFFLQQASLAVGFGETLGFGTIGEAQPLRDPSILYNYYGLAIAIAGVAVVWILVYQIPLGEDRDELLFVAVWAVFITAMTFTQARFSYYLTVPTAILSGYAAARLIEYVGRLSEDNSVQLFEVISVLTVVMLLVFPLVAVSPTVLAASSPQQNGPGGVSGWESSLEWMNDNTPAEGNFAGAANQGEMELYGEYARTDDYQYPAGSYGVLSWWDYGHWITALGERIPIANPFQQGATEAANFLLAPNETQANSVIGDLSDGENAETRYVMVDWKMVETMGQSGGKFFAPSSFETEYDVTTNDYYEPIYAYQESGQQQSFRFGLHRHKPAYYNTTVVRLYRYHGSAVEAQPVVLDWERQSVSDPRYQDSGVYGAALPTTPVNGSVVKFPRSFNNSLAEAREYVRRDGTAQVGGIGPYPAERIPALEHYRLAHVSDRLAFSSGQYQRALQQTLASAGLTRGGQINPSAFQTLHHHSLRTQGWTKTFEKVPGATVEGQGPANTTVYASVQMQVPNQNSTFTYRQQATTNADGEFTMTLPYSTTGYDEWGVENGYTNVSVRATGPYTFQTGVQPTDGSLVRWNGTASVPESKVIGEDTTPVTVSLEQQTVQELTSVNVTENETAGPDTETTAGDAANATQNGTDSTAQTGTNDTAGGSNETTENLARPGESVPDLESASTVAVPASG